MVIRDERDSASYAIKIRKDKIKLISISQPPLIFSDCQPSQDIIYNPIQGIRDYGPYDINTSDRYVSRKFESIEFFVFYPRNEEKILRNLRYLISLLRDGYNENRGNNDVDFKGFEKEFRLRNVFIPEDNEFIAYTPGNLHKELELRKDDFKNVFERGNRPIIIVGGTSHRSTSKNREQYLEAKHQFTNIDIPCQYASYYEYETGGAGILYNIERKDLPFGYSLWNFALNIYGKVGGLAWIIRQELSKATNQVIDLSIGIRFVQPKTRKGYAIGYVTILDRFGRLIGVISSPIFRGQIEEGIPGMVVPRQIMENIIIEALKKASDDARVKEIFEEKETINIAIHRLAAFHSQEIQGIASAVDKQSKSLKMRKIRYALISIIKKSPILAFDTTTKDWNPLRGTAIMLNDNVATLYTRGTLRGDYRRPLSYPIAIIAQNLGEKSCPFISLEEVCYHVCSLTNLHWQTVMPGSVKLPATLEFAQNIAKLSSFGIMPKEGSWLWQTLWFI
jgi:hypothetical protein